MNDFSIGVFDSGFGGLEILREIVGQLPEYNYIYLGDSDRAPYGNRSQESIYKFTKQAVDFLFANNCFLIILACNTVSSGALRRIQREYLPESYPKRRVLGVVIPACEEAVEKSKTGRIGVIGTEATISSNVFEKELKKINPNVMVFQNACPLLVPIVEAGEQDLEITDIAIKNYLKPITKKDIDTLILGCTHYGLLEDKIKGIVGKNIHLISEGKVISEKLKDYLTRHSDIERFLRKGTGDIRFLSTDITEKFSKLGSKFFGTEIRTEKIELC